MQPGRHGKARVAVLTILDEEFLAVKQAFGTDSLVAETRAYSSEDRSGIDRSKRWYDVVVVRAADRGTHEAQTATDDLIEYFRPDFLFLSGIAGGIAGRDDVALGDVVVATYIHYGEYMKLVDKRFLARHGPFDQPARSLHDLLEPIRVDADWCAEVTKRRPEPGPVPKVILGPMLSGEKVLSGRENAIQEELLDYYDNAVAVEMESYGFAKSVYFKRRDPDYNPQLLVVRGISDLVPSGSNVADRKRWKQYASDVAAALTRSVALRVLDRWPVPTDDGNGSD